MECLKFSKCVKKGTHMSTRWDKLGCFVYKNVFVNKMIEAHQQK